MHKETEERVNRLRHKSMQVQASLTNLKEQLAGNRDEWVNAHLKLAENWLGDVEGFFVRALEKDEGRTVAQEAFLLSHAEHHLENVVIPQVAGIQDVVSKYGTNIKTIG